MADERLKEIYVRSVEALRKVVTDMKITEDELHAAGRYFNRLGQSGMCPSLLDVAFAMTSIDATRTDKGGTRPNLEGPYYMRGAPVRPDGVMFAPEEASDAPVLNLSGRVIDSQTGKGVAGAEIDLWHADHNGIYDRKGFRLRGTVRTAEDGSYTIRTIVPQDYAEHDHDPIGELFHAMGQTNHRAAHIHIKIHVDGVECLMTQIFMSQSPTLNNDYVIGSVSDDLTVNLSPAAPVAGEGPQFAGTFDFRIRRRQQAAE